MLHLVKLHPLRGIALASLLALAPAAGLAPSQAAGNKSVNHAWTKVVRGVNIAACNAANIGSGSSPVVGAKGTLENLSVSCSADKSVTFQQLRTPLPNAHACRTTIGDLRNKNKAVAIVADPVPGNPYHCLLSDLTPNQFVAGSKYWD